MLESNSKVNSEPTKPHSSRVDNTSYSMKIDSEATHSAYGSRSKDYLIYDFDFKYYFYLPPILGINIY